MEATERENGLFKWRERIEVDVVGMGLKEYKGPLKGVGEEIM